MNKYYTITVHLETPEMKRFSGAFKVDAYMQHEPFNPIDRCSYPVIASIVGGHSPDRARRVDEDRKKLAEQIAAGITELILDQLKKQDTKNGYQQ